MAYHAETEGGRAEVSGLARRIYDRYRDLSEPARDEDQVEAVVERLVARADDSLPLFSSGDLSSNTYSFLFEELVKLVEAE